MIQHINLLSKRSKTRNLVLMAPLLLPVFILIMLVMAGQSEWRLKAMRDEQAQTQLKIEELKKTLEAKRRAAGLNESQAMARELNQFKSQIEARKEWREWLQKGELGTPLGYSRLLRTLAGVREEGVWLDGIDIAKGGQSLSLSGTATHADAVVRYIAQVNEAFKPFNVQFVSMEISRDASKGGAAAANLPASAGGLLTCPVFSGH